MALRTILFAYKQVSKEEYLAMAENEEKIESGLTVISVFGIKDVIREEVPEAIKTVKRAGLNVIMCTGDNLDTARVIARESNILTHEHMPNSCMTGKDFREAIGGL